MKAQEDVEDKVLDVGSLWRQKDTGFEVVVIRVYLAQDKSRLMVSWQPKTAVRQQSGAREWFTASYSRVPPNPEGQAAK